MGQIIISNDQTRTVILKGLTKVEASLRARRLLGQ